MVLLGTNLVRNISTKASKPYLILDKYFIIKQGADLMHILVGLLGQSEGTYIVRLLHFIIQFIQKFQ